MTEDFEGSADRGRDEGMVGRRGPPEKLWEVEWRFWEQMSAEGIERTSQCQMADLYRRLLPVLKRHAEAKEMDPRQYEELIDDAKWVVEDVAAALNARAKNPQTGAIWDNHPVRDLGRERADWTGLTPVDTDDLSAAVVRYLERPWMQSNTLEWYILRGYVFDTASHMERSLLAGNLAPFTNLAYLLAGGDREKTVFWQAGLTAAEVLGRWFLGPAVVAALYVSGQETWTLWVGVVVALWLTWSLVTLPQRWVRKRVLERDLAMWGGRVKRLSWLYISLSNLVWSPSEMLAAAREVAGWLYLPPPVLSLLRRAEERDPSVFIALPGTERGDEDVLA